MNHPYPRNIIWTSLGHGEKAHNNKNQFRVKINLPFFCTAEEARFAGFNVPNDIPDHAVYKPHGCFEWDNIKQPLR